MSNDTSSWLSLTPASLAPLTVGTWANLVLFTLEIIGMINYFKTNRRRDGIFIKLAVSTNLLFDLLATIAICATAYVYVLTYWGDSEAIQKPHWLFTFVLFTSGLSVVISQSYMIRRYWKMTRQRAALAFLLLVLLATVTGIVGSAVLMAMHSSEAVKNMSVLRNAFMYLGLVAPTIGSALICPLLFWQTCKKGDTPSSRSKFIVGTLVECGLLSALVTAITFFTWSIQKSRELMIWIPFALILARVYSCTTLVALSRRSTIESSLAGMIEIRTTTSQFFDNKPKPAESRPQQMMKLSIPPPPVLEDADTFRLTRSLRIDPDDDSDTSSNISRNLNYELDAMDDARGNFSDRAISRLQAALRDASPSRRASAAASRRESSGGESHYSDAPSVYSEDGGEDAKSEAAGEGKAGEEEEEVEEEEEEEDEEEEEEEEDDVEDNDGNVVVEDDEDEFVPAKPSTGETNVEPQIPGKPWAGIPKW
ncbi:hypothetical protein R3P38DRAFT_610571 [Favolaschia claudopus]|uniref:Uncharacterized protein n=1 Tax=Favolaschia claudopus TaxID=2862362 RepID=A0AAW0CAA6_9AGAR